MSPMFDSKLDNPLGAVSKGEALRMIYKNFNDHITRKHGVIIEGWPLPVFDNPSAIGSQVELNVLLRAWQSGATRFRKMSEDEYMAWMENRTSSQPPLATATIGSSPEISPPEGRNQDTGITPPSDQPSFHTTFNVMSLEPAATPRTSNNAPKKPRKTRSDKGKPRKKPSQVPGANVFHASTQ